MTATLDHIPPITIDDYGHGATGGAWYHVTDGRGTASEGGNPNFCDTVGCGLRCTDPATGDHYPEGATKPIHYNTDVAMDVLDIVETALSAPYLTTGEHAATPEEVEALGKARRLLVRVIAQLNRVAGGDGGGIPDEDVPEVDY